MTAAQVPSRMSARGRRPADSASHPILAAKVAAPEVPKWAVPRERITDLIAEGIRWCPLTIVTGPPGVGKTMALALWAAAEPGAVAWVGLDEFDNRPGVFWSYVMAALRQAGVTLPKSLRAIPRDQAMDEAFLLQLTAELAVLDPPVTLVLDDLHLITDPGIFKGLEFVLRNVGSGLRLLVASRMDPLLPLHRYRLAGQLTEIRASDLAFSLDEAGLLVNQHGVLTEDALQSLNERTEGWAAGLRLAAISLGTHPDPGLFVKELIAEDTSLTFYLVDEVLNVQPPEVREILLSTSILEHVSGAVAAELTGNPQAAGILADLARANALVQPIGSGWYRYHTLFADMLRLRLRHEHPGRVPVLHRRAARWYEQAGVLTEAVRHARAAGDWALAATIAVDDLAIAQILEPRSGDELAGGFAGQAPGDDPAWTQPQPHLLSAALAFGAGQHDSCMAALNAADGLLERLPSDGEPAARLSAAVIRLAVCLRTGDLDAAVAAATAAELALEMVPATKLARHPELRSRLLAGRAAVQMWSGHPDEAVHLLQTRLAGVAAPGREDELAGLYGHQALAEALRGQLRRAAELADQAISLAAEHRSPGPVATPLIARGWVHLARNELREARSCIKLADDALGVRPDKLAGAAAYLVAAGGALAEGRPTVAAQIAARAREGWTVPRWLDQQLALVQSRALEAAGDSLAAASTAERAGPSTAAEVTLAHAWAATGDTAAAQRAVARVLEDDGDVPDQVRLQAWLVEARLCYSAGDDARGRRSLASALRLAEREQLRLPFALERGWLVGVLRRDPELADSHRLLLGPALGHDQLPAPVGTTGEPPALIIEPLTVREREVLVHVSGMLNTAEVAEEMYISVNTVKTHLRNIYRKLAAAHRSEAVRRARQLELI